MIVAASLLSLAAWVYLIEFRGFFWRSTPVLASGMPSGKAKIAVVVPARNEAACIQRSLNSLLAQDYRGEVAIIVVDDNSTDGTAHLAAELEKDGRLTMISGAPLPKGWSGKLWAVHQGLAHERARAADYILLTDADVEHACSHLSALVRKAEPEGLDLVSEMVRLNCETGAERALIPAFVFFFQMLYPFAWVNDCRKSIAGAAGGTMLVSRAALERIDGVSRIRNLLIDDCALAKQIKSTGGRIWLGHGELAFSRRIYSGWRDVWNMIARTAYEQLGHSPVMLLGCIAAIGIIYCAPPLLSLFANGAARVSGILSWVTMALAFQPTLRRYHRSMLWGFALPGIGIFYLCATVASAVRHYSGRGGGWKNRLYPGKLVP